MNAMIQLSTMSTPEWLLMAVATSDWWRSDAPDAMSRLTFDQWRTNHVIDLVGNTFR